MLLVCNCFATAIDLLLTYLMRCCMFGMVCWFERAAGLSMAVMTDPLGLALDQWPQLDSLVFCLNSYSPGLFWVISWLVFCRLDLWTTYSVDIFFPFLIGWHGLGPDLWLSCGGYRFVAILLLVFGTADHIYAASSLCFWYAYWPVVGACHVHPAVFLLYCLCFCFHVLPALFYLVFLFYIIALLVLCCWCYAQEYNSSASVLQMVWCTRDEGILVDVLNVACDGLVTRDVHSTVECLPLRPV
ncbi:hypothetical protein U1Q18_037601 [Sarracenia purpurea var. burkii]